jgi:type II secretory pathway pseudopilin PulG
MKNQKGLSLIEALAFVAISGVVLAGAASLYQSSQSAAQADRAFRTLLNVKTAIDAHLSKGGRREGMRLYDMKQMGLLPADVEFVSAGDDRCGEIDWSCIRTQDGVAIVLDTNLDSDTRGVKFVLNYLSESACNRLLPMLASEKPVTEPSCNSYGNGSSVSVIYGRQRMLLG